MTKELLRKARKAHMCYRCEFPIIKGSRYYETVGRFPLYDKEEEQIGIEYYREKCCTFCHDLPSEKHECEWITEIDYQDYGAPTGFEYCTVCYTKREIQ